MSERAARAAAGWLDAVPDHWEVGNIRRFARMKTGHTPSRGEPTYWADCTIPWFTLADVWQLRDGKQKFLGDTSEKISELGLRNSAAELLPAGTVVLSRTASVGFTGIMPVPMATSQDFWNWVCGPKLLSDFLYWQLCAMGHKFRQLTNGSTHKTIYQGDAASLEVCVPPLLTQRRIAQFLDEKTVRIDGLIEKKRALLDRLAEKRQVLITLAVTKGLDPVASMKPSGIDWLGDIPAHWDVQRLDRLTEPRRPIRYGIVLPGPHVNNGVPIIKGGDVRPKRLNSETLSRTTHEIDASHSRSRLRTGDIVYSIRGSFGDVEALPDELDGVNLTQDAARISPIAEIDSGWLLFTLKSDAVFMQLSAGAIGATIKGINIRDLRRALLPLPPRSEQEQIRKWVMCRIGGIDRQIETVLRSAELLVEYRSALITAAVTGKVGLEDVEHAPQLEDV